MSDGIEWRDGVPISTRFDDPYYSLDNGLAESRHVFLAGCGLPDRFCDGFQVAELGFGTGLNLLATWASWRAAGCSGVLRYTSFEAFPMEADAMVRAQAAFPELAEEAALLAPFWATGARDATIEGLRFALIEGDARVTVPQWAGMADAWFLDGFSPAKNPELWEPDLLGAVAARMAPDGRLASYSAAGHVRRALSEAGLSVARQAGYGRKRHMTVAARTAAP